MLDKLKSLGPGLLYAGAAIGVSHIVQSTRAGAEYGYVLILAVLIAHIFKYPFFVLGPRYVHHTGKSLVEGFASLHRVALLLLFLLTLSTMFTIQSAVTVVTAGLAEKLTGFALGTGMWSFILLALCASILIIGRFNVLDRMMKVIMIVLAISTTVAVFFSFQVEVQTVDALKKQFEFSTTDIAFLIAFVGWMPAPLDIAIWHSIWSKAKQKLQGSSSIKAVNLDFRVGFYGTAILAIGFIILGANTIYGTGAQIEASAGKFANQLVDMYTESLGAWSHGIIVIAAFTTMFSTTLTCFDALPRVMSEIGKEMNVKWMESRYAWMGILTAGTLIILLYFVGSMKQMVTVATVVSFLTAPLLAYLSYLLVKKQSKEVKLWSGTETKLALAGLIFLSVFSIYYLITL